MKRQKAKFSKPLKPWSKQRIEEERKLLEEYGLRRHKEIWRAESILREWRHRARELAARKDPDEEKKLLEKMKMLGLLKQSATLDGILQLQISDLLNRRLQTLVYKHSIALTQKQARQFIVHGHIAVDGRKVHWPSMLVSTDEENKINFYERSKAKPERIKQAAQEAAAEIQKV